MVSATGLILSIMGLLLLILVLKFRIDALQKGVQMSDFDKNLDKIFCTLAIITLVVGLIVSGNSFVDTDWRLKDLESDPNIIKLLQDR